jgi:hypothetical protein
MPGKVPFKGIVAYSKNGESIEDQHNRFATELVAGVMSDMLWKSDGRQGSTICIQKEIWININGKGSGLGDGTQYPVFFVYNHIDYSKTIPMAGGKVNKEPFYFLDKAIKLADYHFAMAQETSEWVPFNCLKCDSLMGLKII